MVMGWGKDVKRGTLIQRLQLVFSDRAEEQDGLLEAKLSDESLQRRGVRGRRSGDDQLGGAYALAHLDHGADRQVEALLRVMPVGQKDVWPADRIPVDRQSAAETGCDRQRKTRGCDVTSSGAIDRRAAIGL